MNKLILSPVVASSIATCAFLASSSISPIPALADSERSAITAQADDSLLALRAGAATTVVPMGADERAALQRAQFADQNLLGLRAGDVNLSHRDWTIIGVILLAVLVIIIVA